jgi:hypothetical protein
VAASGDYGLPVDRHAVIGKQIHYSLLNRTSCRELIKSKRVL